MQLGLISRTPKYIGPEESLDISLKIVLDKKEPAIRGTVRLGLYLMDNYDSANGYAPSAFVVAEHTGINVAPGGSIDLRFVGRMPPGEHIAADAPDGGAARRYIYGLQVMADHADGYLDAYMGNVGYIFAARNPPEITDFTPWEDDSGALAMYGQLAQGRSNLRVQAAYALDPLVPGLTGSERLEAILKDDQSGEDIVLLDQRNQGGLFSIPVIQRSGELTLRYTAMDAYGLSAAQEKKYTVFPYAPPEIRNLKLERYKAITLDDGSTQYRAAADGDRVWVSLEAQTTPILGKNFWMLGAYISNGADDESFDVQSFNIAQGDDGGIVSFTDDRSLIPVEVPVDRKVEFTFFLQDSLGYCQQIQVAERAHADFHVSPNGSAVGQRSTGTADHRKFEVAPTHESFFYGGISGITNYTLDEVPTGGRWIDGRMIYRKTFAVNVTSTTQIWQSAAIPGFAHMINLYGAYIRTATGTNFPIFFWAAADNYHYTNVSGTDGRVNIRTTAALTGYVTIEYVKTADS